MINQTINYFNEFAPVNETLINIFRASYALVAIATLVQFFPIRHLYFSSSEQCGYIYAGGLFKRLNRVSTLPLFAVWLTSLGFIAVGKYLLIASVINLSFSYIFFITQRWSSISRGFGAPGFIFNWCAVAVALVSFTSTFFPELLSLSVLLLKFDFAVVILTSAVSKVLSGYPKNHGIQYGVINPMWGYFPKFFSSLPPKGRIFASINHLGWIGQSLTAICLLITPLNEVGGLLLAFMFFLINVPVRLGPLCFMLMIIGLIYQPAQGTLTNLLNIEYKALPFPDDLSTPALFFGTILISYIATRPFTVIGLWINFYGRKKLPKILQVSLEKYTNFFGIILWRVFTADLLNFWVDIYKVQKDGTKVRLSKYNKILNFRFNQVCESIAITCIFTSLKYFPDDPTIFEKRLSLYVKSLGLNLDESAEFRYYDIDVSADKFVNSLRWVITTNSIGEIANKEQVNEAPESLYSSVKAGYKPGTYAPSN